MNPAKIAAVTLDADRASANEDGYLIFDGSPSDWNSHPITRLEKGNMIDERARSETAAIRTLREQYFRSPTVKLESWAFPDPITDNHHDGKVWVMQLPQQGSRRKKTKSAERKSKTATRSRSKTSRKK